MVCICLAPDDKGASQSNHLTRQRKNLGVALAVDVAGVCAVCPPAPRLSMVSRGRRYHEQQPGTIPQGREMLCLGLKAGLVWRVSRVVKLWLFGVVSRVVSKAVRKPKARRGGPRPS